MQMQTTEEQKRKHLSDEHVYYPLIRNPVTVIALFFMVFFGVQDGQTVYYAIVSHQSPYHLSIGWTIGFSILSLLFWLGFLSLPVFLLMKIRLVTSPQGIIFYGIGYSIYAPWSNLVGRGKMSRKNTPVNSLLFAKVEGLQFEPPTTPMSLTQAIEQHRPAIEGTGRNKGLYRFARIDMIPIGYFLHDWQHSPLAQEIHRYAPQVFARPS
jgi:hypothetical protein